MDRFFYPLPAARIENLSDIPSPFLSGLLDEFFDENLMPVLTTNRVVPLHAFCAETNTILRLTNQILLEFNKS